MSAADIAAAFVRARRTATALPDFPGAMPADLTGAYAIQDLAIKSWPDRIVGWKIGLIPPQHVERLAAPRLAGPIFARQLMQVGPAPTEFAVFEGGFAAVEAEFVIRVARDAPADKADWTYDEALDMVGSLHIGMEPAGSPLATINALGPTVVVSDFGNNAGLILGPEIAGWRAVDWAGLPSETWIDGVKVGAGSAASVPGGPVEALRFLLAAQAKRGLPLKAGDLITTGATTGIHDIIAGQSASVRFGRHGEIQCKAVRAKGESDHEHGDDRAG